MEQSGLNHVSVKVITSIKVMTQNHEEFHTEHTGAACEGSWTYNDWKCLVKNWGNCRFTSSWFVLRVIHERICGAMFKIL